MYEKAIFCAKNIKGKGSHLGTEPPCIKFFLLPLPPGQNVILKLLSILFCLFSFLFTISVFSFSCSILTAKSFYCHGKNFAKENFHAPAWISVKSYCENKTAIPSAQYRSILPARVANQSTEFAASCPLVDLAI